MAWNDPGGKGNDGKKPWQKQDGPPDLDEAFRQFQRKLRMTFGG